MSPGKVLLVASLKLFLALAAFDDISTSQATR